MLKVNRPTPSHFGIFVTDLERMVAFYTETFDLTVTDRGEGRTFRNKLVFMSASADQHHQLVLASGRPVEAKFSTVMQISFVVPGIQHLREISARAAERGATEIRGLNTAMRCPSTCSTLKQHGGDLCRHALLRRAASWRSAGSLQGRRDADARDRGSLPPGPHLHAARAVASAVRGAAPAPTASAA